MYQVRSAHPEPTGTASFPQGGPEHGYTAVASAIRRRGGPTVLHTYLWQLRRGLRDNPTKQHLEALADFFGVPPSYFFDDAAGPRPEADLELRAASRDGRVRRLALLAHGLSARSLDALADMAELARRAERLEGPDGPARARDGDADAEASEAPRAIRGASARRRGGRSVDGRLLRGPGRRALGEEGYPSSLRRFAT